MLELLTIKKVIAGLLLIYGVLGISKAFSIFNRIEDKIINKGSVKHSKKEIKELKEELKKMKEELNKMKEKATA